jgi:hypothetical protein
MSSDSSFSNIFKNDLITESFDSQEYIATSYWRRQIIAYLQDPSSKMECSVRSLDLKYTLVDCDLYREIEDGLLIKCLNEGQSFHGRCA